MSKPKRERGFTMMELMVAMTIGLVIVLALASLLARSIDSQATLQRDAEQMENGRVALETISQDIKLAGFFDAYIPATPSAMPDPCESQPPQNLFNAMGVYIQLLPAGSASAKPDVSAATADAACAGMLSAGNTVAGSDIVVIRRGSTAPMSAAPTDKAYYLQTGAFDAQLQNSVTGSWPATANLMIRQASGSIVAGPWIKWITRIYFVAPCSNGSGTVGGLSGVCQSGDDTTPTLKRLELSAGAGGPAWALAPMADGIEALRVDLGIDSFPTTASSATGSVGDGQPENFTHAPSLSDLSNAVAATVSVLARNIEPKMDFTDQKTYVLGEPTSGPTSMSFTSDPSKSHFRRHLYTAKVKIENPSQRRELPR